MSNTVSMFYWLKKKEEPPLLASNNLLGSFVLSKFAGHGKPSICVSFVPATKCKLLHN